MAIYLDRDGVESVVSAITKAVNELEQAAAHIDSNMGQIGEYWQGNAYQKTMDNYNENYKKMLTETVPSTVNGLKDYISKCKQAIVEVDQQLSGN